MWDQLREFWPHAAVLLNTLVAVLASGHAVLHKRDSRAATAWVGLIWLAPFVGAALYVWLGINRIQRRARLLRFDRYRPSSSAALSQCSPGLCAQSLGEGGAHLETLANLIHGLTHRPLLFGNRVVPLVNGDQAYPAMLDAIDNASQSVTLSTYIFDNDRAGGLFLEALRQATSRGVQVRVLIDDMGARYTFPSMPSLIRRAGIPVARFLPTMIPWRFHFSNLRTHRKIMVVDGRIGFTGGMNLREGHCLEWKPRYPVQDLHFRVTGPIVNQLQEVFAEDWAFCTDEVLRGEPWFTQCDSDGPVIARGLADGPDEHLESFRLALLGAIATARSSLVVLTPYFLPDSALITALNIAAMRGISVDIILPQQNNLALVQWASTALLWQLLERGCRIWLSPPPFDHSKMLLVDGLAAFVGSSNWDPRSLRLNFEFNLECYDRELAALLMKIAQSKIRQSRRLTLADADGRKLPTKLRDGLARLFSPYL